MATDSEQLQAKIDELIEIFKEQTRIALSLQTDGLNKEFNEASLLIKLKPFGQKAKSIVYDDLKVSLDVGKPDWIDEIGFCIQISKAAKEAGADVSELDVILGEMDIMMGALIKKGFTLEEVKNHCEERFEENPKLKNTILR